MVQQVSLEAIKPTIDKFVQHHMVSLQVCANNAWPPVLDMSEDDGCASITALLQDSARDMVVDALGPRAPAQESCLQLLVQDACIDFLAVEPQPG